MLKFKNRINLKTIFFVMLILLISSCSGEGLKNINAKAVSNIGSYVVKYNDYLYYYKYSADHIELYRRDLKNGSEEYVDTLTDPDTGYWGVVKMFLIDTRLYYGKSTDKADIVAIYSVDVNDPQPQFEGSINELIDDHAHELYVDYEFKIFELGDKIYALANDNIYELNGEASERVAGNVSGISVDGEKIYYSLCVDNINSGGIMCYDTNDKTNTEIVSDEDVRAYNKTTINGNICKIQNIFVDEKTLYFLGTPESSEILKYDLDGNKGVQGLTHRAYTRLFRMQNENLYYINSKQELCCVNTDGTDTKKLIENERVFSFNVCENTVYYYRLVGKSGYPAGLIEMDLQTGKKHLISRFR